ESLRQDRFHALFQERAGVQVWQADRNQRDFHSVKGKHPFHSVRLEPVGSFGWSWYFLIAFPPNASGILVPVPPYRPIPSGSLCRTNSPQNNSCPTCTIPWE